MPEVCAGSARKPKRPRECAHQSIPADLRRRTSASNTRRAGRSSHSTVCWSTSNCPVCSAGRGHSRTSRSMGLICTSRFSATEASTLPHSWTAWRGATSAVSSGDQPPRRWLLQHARCAKGRSRSATSRVRPPPHRLRADQPRGPRPRHAARRHGRYAIRPPSRWRHDTWRGDVSVLPTASAGELEVNGVQARHRLGVPEGQDSILPRPRGASMSPPATSSVTGRERSTRAGGHPRSGLRAGAPRTGGEPILALDTIATNGGRFDLARRELVVPSIELATVAWP